MIIRNAKDNEDWDESTVNLVEAEDWIENIDSYAWLKNWKGGI